MMRKHCALALLFVHVVEPVEVVGVAGQNADKVQPEPLAAHHDHRHAGDQERASY